MKQTNAYANIQLSKIYLAIDNMLNCTWGQSNTEGGG